MPVLPGERASNYRKFNEIREADMLQLQKEDGQNKGEDCLVVRFPNTVT